MAKRKPTVKTIGSKLRPSNADRYLNCPASVVVAQDLPVGEGTVYSNRGDLVHQVVELCILDNTKPEDYLGQAVCQHKGNDLVFETDDLPGAEFYLDWVKAQGFTEVYVESQLDFPWIKNPKGEKTTGKADLVGYDADFNRLVVGDYKNGFMPVPDDSYQFAMYAYPLLMSGAYPVEEVEAVRIQPNVQPGVPQIGAHIWTKGDMHRLRAKIEFTTDWVRKTKPESIKEKDYCEGHWCKFCPLASADAGDKMCPKKLAELFDPETTKEVVQVASNKLPAPSTMTDEQIAGILEKRPLIKKWLDDVYKMMLTKAQQGVEIPGMKLVQGKAKPREWKKDLSQTELVEALIQLGGLKREACLKAQEVVTPAVAKKLLKGKLDAVEDLLMPAETGVELVPADSDKGALDGSDLF